MKNISGEYNSLGYSVWINDGRGNWGVIYTALNHRQDSQQPAYEEQDRMTLREIRRACIRTCREMAQEMNRIYIGVERITDEL